jgi:hypothetical protein
MDELKSLYIDMPSWDEGVEVDDFLIAIGKKQSNSVYHVAEVKCSPRKDKRITRYNMKVYKSDLITMLKRDEDQRLITLVWYSRDKKK